MAILAPFSDPIELKKFDFSQKPMGMPLIPFWGLETAKKGVSIAFLAAGGHKFWICTLYPKQNVPNDYQQF